MEFLKIVNFFDITSDDKNFPKFVTKNGLKSLINQEEIIDQTRKSESKHQC